MPRPDGTRTEIGPDPERTDEQRARIALSWWLSGLTLAQALRRARITAAEWAGWLALSEAMHDAWWWLAPMVKATPSEWRVYEGEDAA